MSSYSAPGKAVLWGEYAVLAGAPAMVMAVNRYAICRIAPRSGDWLCRAEGLAGEVVLSTMELLSDRIPMDSPAAVTSAALRALNVTDLTTGAEVATDTSAFYSRGTKYGIGSSAAICTATCAALASWLGIPLKYDGALRAHRLLQGGQGSGIDVAAAFHGGLVRFRQGEAAPATWPADLRFQFIWSGHSARTTDQLRRFRAWQARADGRPLDALVQASEALFEHTSMESLSHYRLTLQNFDDAADLGIYSGSHRKLDELAMKSQVVYKPCGAGGGDIGVAFSRDAQALQHFSELAEQHSFQTLALEIADHGVQPTG